jgi:hypothetical protein
MVRNFAWLSLALLTCSCGGGAAKPAGDAAGATDGPFQRGTPGTPGTPGTIDGAPLIDGGATDGVVPPAADAAPAPGDAAAGPPDAGDAGPRDAGPPDGAPAPDAGMGRPCTAGGANACPAGSFCSAPNCINGTCVAAPASDATMMPVCGCDDLTYWNGGLAARRGVDVRSQGVCAVGRTCGGIASLNCPNGTTCNHEVNNAPACMAADLGGVCWVMPNACPPAAATIGPNTRRCGAARCQPLCDLIVAEQSFYVDNTCP